jgi:hypothetical protein
MKKLKRLRVREISVVDKGAAEGAFVVMVKHANGMKEYRPMKSREVVKRAVDVGDVTVPDLMRAVQKRADKEIEGPTEAIRFSRYVERHPT